MSFWKGVLGVLGLGALFLGKKAFSTSYDREGYDKNGFDRNGFDRAGFDKKGFNKNGYDRDGYNKNGFNFRCYNRAGRDVSDNSFADYLDRLVQIKKYEDSAYKQMKKKEFAYALHDVRIGLEIGIKCLIEHCLGAGLCRANLNDNINVCAECYLLDSEMINKLHSARMHCNDAQHDSVNNEKSVNQVFFACKVLEELRGILSRRLTNV